jgi:hypothetical protein
LQFTLLFSEPELENLVLKLARAVAAPAGPVARKRAAEKTSAASCAARYSKTSCETHCSAASPDPRAAGGDAAAAGRYPELAESPCEFLYDPRRDRLPAQLRRVGHTQDS